MEELLLSPPWRNIMAWTPSSMHLNTSGYNFSTSNTTVNFEPHTSTIVLTESLVEHPLFLYYKQSTAITYRVYPCVKSKERCIFLTTPLSQMGRHEAPPRTFCFRVICLATGRDGIFRRGNKGGVREFTTVKVTASVAPQLTLNLNTCSITTMEWF